MTHKITATQLPEESICSAYIETIDFQDTYRISLADTAMLIEDIYIGIFTSSPKWVNRLLALRNNIVGILGLDNFKSRSDIMKKEQLKIGSKVGIFKIYSISENEIIAGEDDRHLNFRVSVLKQNELVMVSTLVQYNNYFGKLYMKLIMPFHKMVVKALLKRFLQTAALKSAALEAFAARPPRRDPPCESDHHTSSPNLEADTLLNPVRERTGQQCVKKKCH